jgi:Domain of unknown function (DUF4286)
MSKGVILNITIKVERSVAADYLQWLLKEHVPRIMQTGCFNDHKVVQLLDVDDTEGPTYALQLMAAKREDYERYLQKFSSSDNEAAYQRWGQAFIAFRTLMQVVK